MANHRRNIKKKKIPKEIEEIISYLATQFSKSIPEELFNKDDLKQELYTLYFQIKKSKKEPISEVDMFYISFKNHLTNLYHKARRIRKNETRLECGTNT